MGLYPDGILLEYNDPDQHVINQISMSSEDPDPNTATHWQITETQGRYTLGTNHTVKNIR